MRAKDVMTHCVVSISPAASITEAIARMLSHQVSGMPVIDADGTLVGIVTEGDFVRRAEIHTEGPARRWLELLLGAGSRAEEYARSHGRTVADVMSPDVVSVGREMPLADVVRVMEEDAVKRVPVVDNGRLVGILSRSDLMVALAHTLREARYERASDESIRDEIVREMRKQTWCPLHAIRVAVRDGIVEVYGEIFDDRQRRALRVLVENCDGVRAIRDHLELVEAAKTTSRI